MKTTTRHLHAALALGLAAPAAVAGGPVTTGVLLDEMHDLAALASWPDPAWRNVQFSSHDRRSTTPEAPGWFSNADGFGSEPVPAFAKTLREPEDGGAGLYLVAGVSGPGAIVRGWSAGMDGTLRVRLDPSAVDGTAGDGTLVYEGPAYGFLARRSAHLLEAAGVDVEAGNAFIQQDADYFPIPFAKGLVVTWEGRLEETHFYQLQVRRYPGGTAVRSFDPAADPGEFEGRIRAAVEGLTKPAGGGREEAAPLTARIDPGAAWSWSPGDKGPGAIRELTLRVAAGDVGKALRGCLLRIAFDGSQRPQVEAPLGDFFASGPGVNPFSSLPFTVAADGSMTCRFVMPFRDSAKLEVVNCTPAPVDLDGRVRVGPWRWDDNSMYFHGKWRVDPNLHGGVGNVDLPFAVVIGKGVFVGCAAMIRNPSGVPTAGGNWWGEGDEKFLVDGETTPSIFGTGSEDYFNYSWSRSDLFGDPYCGQPLDSGPDTSGLVSNHRFQVIDAVPFERSLAAVIELWTHSPTPGMSYARIGYYYARPDAMDDHRGLTPGDLELRPLPRRTFEARGAAAGARSVHFDDLRMEATAGRVEIAPLPIATRLHVANWQAGKGGRLKFELPVEEDGRVSLHLVAVHRPDGAAIRVLLDGVQLPGSPDAIPLRSAFAPRVLNVNLPPVEVKAGRPLAIELECVEPGVVGLDSIWIRKE